MDFSRLHMYSPPQCVPENTGYTYALSSSYSSDALDFETEHKLDPVFDSPRMSRRSLRLVTTAHAAEDGPAAAAAGDRAARVTKQRGSAGRLALTLNHTSRKGLSLAAGQSSAGAVQGEACLRPPVLDESLIREQTKVDHFWGELPALSLRLFWEEGRCWLVVPLPLAGWEQAQEGSRFPLDSRGTASTC